MNRHSAATEAAEFSKIYNWKLRYSDEPNADPHRSCRRRVPHGKEKFEAVVNGIMQERQFVVERHPPPSRARAARLVGTISIEIGNHRGLLKNPASRTVLNAKQHERESRVVAQRDARRGHRGDHMAGRARHSSRRQSRTDDARSFSEKQAGHAYAAAPAVIAADPLGRRCAACCANGSVSAQGKIFQVPRIS